jgi:16S rRNA (adenine1518-N6/adenine1519-N6)-dimethyltransferase
VTRLALPPLAETIRRHGLGARHALGQHFLLDPAITARIAAAAGDLSAGTTIEIGPGPGGLTRALVEAGARHVFAVEIDERCLNALDEIAAAAPGRLTLVQADALAFDAALECGRRGLPGPYRVVANLPYNVATPLLVGWLDGIARYAGFVLMLQKEVADRLAAPPGGKTYGRLSVMAQWRARVERLFVLPPGAFVPRPKVHSAVVRLTPRAAPQGAADVAAMARVVAAAFGQRRKMLRRSLAALGDAEALLAAAGIAGTKRAEELAVEDFAALARAYAAGAA